MKSIPTPWGPSQDTHEVTPGIVQVSTAGHGGILLDSERWAYLLRHMPDFKSWAEKGALEEDVDAAAAALLWPALFGAKAVYYAVQTARCDFHNCDVMRAFLDSPAGAKARTMAEEFKASIADLWERGSMWTEGKGWGVGFTHVTTGEYQTVNFPGYPEKSHYSTAELDAIECCTVEA